MRLPRPLLVLIATPVLSVACGTAPDSRLSNAAPPARAIDRDLLDVTVPRLEQLYAGHSYTVTQVVQWHLDRIDRYNPIYGAIETVLRRDALADAARLDAESASGTSVSRGPLWGVPIVIKANTSVKDEITTAGWAGFTKPGHELIAPMDATIVAKFRGAGAIIIGLANMPDLANSDTNRSSSFGRTGNAYDVRFSPGGSSGGVVTAVAANFAVLGNGTDTGNSIRMPAATSALFGVFPTRGLVSIAGIAPLDWLLDNTGPIARTATDAAIALSVMAGADSLDPRTTAAAASAQHAPYQTTLKSDALKGKRFGVPAFVLSGEGIPFHGIPGTVSDAAADTLRDAARIPLQPETREMFMKSLDALRRAGAEIVITDDVLPASFAKAASRVATYAYMADGTDRFLSAFGPEQFHSGAEYLKVAGAPLYASSIGAEDNFRNLGTVRISQRVLDKDPDAERMYLGPRKAMLAEYVATLDRLKLDGFVYPAIQMPPPDETMPQDGRVSEGPHSATSWINMIGVPAVVMPAGFYATGLPFGLEISARPWSDAQLLSFAYAWEQATHLRRPPVLADAGMLRVMTARAGRTEQAAIAR
jgi:amidase